MTNIFDELKQSLAALKVINRAYDAERNDLADYNLAAADSEVEEAAANEQ